MATVDNGTGILPGHTTEIEAKNLSGEPSHAEMVNDTLKWSFAQSKIRRLIEISIVEQIVTEIVLRPSKQTAEEIISTVGPPDLISLPRISPLQHPPSLPYLELLYPTKGVRYLLRCKAVKINQCEGVSRTDIVLYETYFVPVGTKIFVTAEVENGLLPWNGFIE
ncbi:MAG: hypothetical protein B6D41_10075 [Chloroflexi bacterium UTCFX4]|nr:MAG: hypothetical protein B6D41_10075 [Chloroflexi bacterium UTCFX4]